MPNVWIVSAFSPSSFPFDKILSERADCLVLSLSDVEETASVYSALSRPDMLIVDLAGVHQPPRAFLQHVNRLNPDAMVVAVAPPENAVSVSSYAQAGVDEVILRPPNEQQTTGTTQQLLKRIAALDQLLSLQEKLQKDMSHTRIVAKSRSMRDILQRLPLLASSRSTVLITGETGTGKELVARAIHYLGPRAGRPFVTVDCGTMPEHLVENELFGHTRGAYTDAGSPYRGLIQEADNGTLFLDEVEALPLTIQAKFLRFLQDRQFKPLGQSKYSSVDVRVVAATNVDLARAVELKQFREDLYYRLNVVPLFIPPLRERKADIFTLASYFMVRHTTGVGSIPQIPDDILQRWFDHDWPGNVRELENRVQEWLTTRETSHGESWVQHTGRVSEPYPRFAEAKREALDRCEQDYFKEILRRTLGNISAAARIAGIDRKNLRRLLKKHSIDAFDFRRRR
jgi:DNA-binding NtrC family response regulator